MPFSLEGTVNFYVSKWRLSDVLKCNVASKACIHKIILLSFRLPENYLTNKIAI